MITFSGIHIQKIGGLSGTPTPIDIAVQSSRICRFGGAIYMPLLTHLVFVGLLARSRGANLETVKWAFLHDAHEIATSDVPTPFKCDCLRREQEAIDERLFEAFKIDRTQVDFDLIKLCDFAACNIEATELGLPGYREISAKYSSVYECGSDAIYENLDDRKIFQWLLRSDVYNFDQGNYNPGAGAGLVTVLLSYIQNGNDHLLEHLLNNEFKPETS